MPAQILVLFDFAQVLGKLSLSSLMLELLDLSVLSDDALAHIKIIFFRERSVRGRETPVGLSAGGEFNCVLRGVRSNAPYA